MKLRFLLLFALLPLAGFIFKAIPDGKPVKGVDKSAMDTKVDPRKNFYLFANGTWLKNNPVPDSESTWNGFNEVNEKVNTVLKSIMDDMMNPEFEKKTRTEHLLTAFYTSAMDSNMREMQGISAIRPLMDQIDRVEDKETLSRTIGELHTYGINPFFSIFVMADAKQSDVNIPYLWQNGLGMPDKSYYLQDDERSVKVREAYLKHIENIFSLAGYEATEARSGAQQVMEIEKKLALKSRSKTELRDTEKMYNVYKPLHLEELVPNLNWQSYQEGAEFQLRDKLIVGQPEYYEAVNEILSDDKNLPAIKNYIRFHLLTSTASKLNTAFEKEQFDFFGKTLYGIKEQKPRWKRVISVSNELIGEAVGKIYVERTVSPETKEKVNQMVEDLTQAFNNRLQSLAWMSPETKERAVHKLSAVSRKLAYPDKWEEYEGLHIEPHSYAGNYLNAMRFNYQKDMAKAGKPVDRDEWGMNPQTVNAYYNPLNNEIVFPAAIMQPPFYYPGADDAVNYGSMGAVIGHELTHGFDDQGCLFNAEGNMENWWAASDLEQFKSRAQHLATQYSAYEVEKGVFINGELTLGENIADLGGLSMAYDALQLSLKRTPGKVIDGYTPEQRFFIGFAQVWRNNSTSEYLSTQVRTDPHSPARYRVEGTLSNMPEFHQAFNLQPGDPLYKNEDERVKIW